MLGYTKWRVLLADLDDGVDLRDMELGQLVVEVKHTMAKLPLSITDI